jgi:hypothetical protein
MATFSNNELTDIVLTYGESQGNAALAQRMYSRPQKNRADPLQGNNHQSIFRQRDLTTVVNS